MRAGSSSAWYRELAGIGRATGDIGTIVTAAYDGRIDTLFIAVDRQQEGFFTVGTARPKSIK